MRIVVQNVTEAKLSISTRIIASIERGYVLFVGFTAGDGEEIVREMVDKVLSMRVFSDDDGKTNLSISDIEGQIMAVPQFTLYADLTRGRRPSFIKAMPPVEAEGLFDYFVSRIKSLYPRVSSGLFKADMQVNLINDGPFTIILDSAELFVR